MDSGSDDSNDGGVVDINIGDDANCGDDCKKSDFGDDIDGGGSNSEDDGDVDDGGVDSNVANDANCGDGKGDRLIVTLQLFF